MTGLYIIAMGAYFCILAGIALTDLRTCRIPRPWTLGLTLVTAVILGLDVMGGTAGTGGYWFRALGGPALCSLLMWTACRLLQGKGIGGGDIRLCIISSVLLGPEGVTEALLAASVLALPQGLYAKAGGGRCFPFGPYLAAGIWIALLRLRLNL